MPPLIPKSSAVSYLLAYKHRRESLLKALLQSKVPMQPHGLLTLTHPSRKQSSHKKTLLSESNCHDSMKSLLGFRQGYKCMDSPSPGQEMLFPNKRGDNNKLEYRCEICDKVFGQLSTMNVHLRTHFGDTPFKYRRCPETFTPLANLQKHEHFHKGNFFLKIQLSNVT